MTIRYLIDTDWVIRSSQQGRTRGYPTAGVASSRPCRQYRVPGDFDLFIAATGLHYGLTLLTNNRRHFERVEGLQIESI